MVLFSLIGDILLELDLYQLYRDEKYNEVIEVGLKYMAEHQIADYLHLVGLSLVREKKVIGGCALLAAASTMLPKVEWFRNACDALIGSYPENCFKFAMEGLTKHPNDVDLLRYKGISMCMWAGDNSLIADRKVILAQNRTGLEALDASLEIAFDTNAMLNKGNAHLILGEPLKALECYNILLDKHEKKEIELNDDLWHRIALIKGRSLADLVRDHEAIEWFETGLGMMPEFDMIYGMTQLSVGNFETGWKYYDARKAPGRDGDLYKPVKPVAKTLDELIGKRLLITGEQGMGDMIQCVRFLPQMEEYASEVIFLTYTPLLRFFQHLYPDSNFVTERPSEDSYDVEISAFDPAMLLNINETNIPPPPEYTLIGDEDFDHDFTVGFCWSGNNIASVEEMNERRSISFDLMRPLLDIQGVDFVSLQKDKSLHAEFVFNIIDDDFDYYDSAEAMESLDLVITVDTSVAHLAATMGKEVWLLSRYGACWRWMRDRSDTPWYPTMTIYRQPAPLEGQSFSEDWQSVIETVQADLAQRVFEDYGIGPPPVCE